MSDLHLLAYREWLRLKAIPEHERSAAEQSVLTDLQRDLAKHFQLRPDGCFYRKQPNRAQRRAASKQQRSKRRRKRR